MGQSPDSSTVNEINSVGMPFLQGNAEFGDKHPSPKYSCIRPPRVGETGATLISVRAPVGQTNIADRDYCIGRGLAAVRAHEYGPALCRAIMAHKAGTLKKVSQGTTFEAISRDDLLSLQVPRIPNAEANLIESVLDTLDIQIQKTDALIAKLEKIKEGLLHDLLTRGIDHNGQLRPSPEKAPELYQESALGLIPRDWAVSSAHQDFVIDSGFTLGAHRRPQRNARPYLRVANVHRGRLDLSEIAYLEANDEEMAKKSLSKDDLLIVEGHANPGEIGRCAMATESVSGYTFQNHLFRLKAIALIPHFAFLWMNSDTVKKYWRKAASSSSGLYTINRTKLEAVPTAKPKNAEQLAISRLVKKHEDEIATATQEHKKLKKLKAGISDDLLTGKVRVTSLLKDAV